MSETLKFGNGQWATKVGSTLAYNDEGGNFKPLPFNFTRSTSGTRVNKDGLIEVVTNNEPRIDFLNDSKGALLLEPTRSNLFTYSEEFNNATWGKYRLDLGTNTQVSPSGVQNADTFTSSDGQVLVPSIARTNITFSGNTRYSYSIYAKKIGTTDLFVLGYIDNSTGFTGGQASYNLTTQSITITQSPNASVTASMESVGNGWYRVVLNFLTIATPTFNYVEMNIPTTSNTNTFAIWGAQLEQGSYATSYIPTQGAISTRVDEVCNGAGNEQVINSTEGVLYYESKVYSLIGDKAISVSSGSYNDSVSIGVYGGVFQSRIRQGGDFKHFISPIGVNLLNNNKIAIMYSQSNIKIFVNGSLKSTVSGVTYSVNLSKVSFTRADITDKYYGLIKDLRVYNEALTDQELINLTTI